MSDMSDTITSVVLPSQYVTIEEECKRNPKLKMSDLQMLKDWMDKQPHLPHIEMFYLVLFLHRNDYFLEPTKKMIDEFFTLRMQMPEIFFNRDPIACEGLRKSFSVSAFVPLEQKTKEGYNIILTKFLNTNPRMFDMHECLKHVFMLNELQHTMIGTSKGLVIIYDVAGLSFGHLTCIKFTHIKRLMHFMQEVIPIHLQTIHVLNTMYLIKIIVSILKPFMKATILNCLHFHRTLETLKEFLPIEALPNEYGGKAGPIMEINAKHIKLLEENREWFLYIDNQVNKSLRIKKSQSTENLSDSSKKTEID